MSDQFYETDVDLEATEYDDEMSSLMDGIESLDGEFFNPLDPLGVVSGGLSAVGNVLSGLGGASRGAARGLRGPQPNVQRYPTRLPTPTPGIPNPILSRTFATQAQVQALAKQVTANRASISTVNKRAEVINNRVNTVEKKLSAEVTRINAVNVSQGQVINRQNKTISTLREDLEKSTQTTMMLTLLSSGKKDYDISTEAGGAINSGTKVTLKPSGGSLDMLLPFLLFSGGSSGSKGGMFDNPLILILLLDSLGNK